MLYGVTLPEHFPVTGQNGLHSRAGPYALYVVKGFGHLHQDVDPVFKQQGFYGP